MKVFISVFLLLSISLSTKTFGQQFKPDSLLAASLYQRGLDLHKIAKYDSAIILFDSASAIFAKSGNVGDQILCRIKKADCLRVKSNYDKAIEALRIGPDLEQRLLRKEPLVAAQRFIMLGSVWREQAKYDTALVVAKLALNIHRDNFPLNNDLEWDIYTLFAGTYFSFGDHDSALSYNRRALELFPSPDGEKQLKISGTYNSIAGIFETRGDYQKALDYYTRSLDIRRLALGEKHPDISNLYNNIAAIYFRAGDFDLSLEYYMKSLSIMKESLTSDNPSFAIRYNNIAMSYRGKEDFDKALEYGEKSRIIFVKKLGEKHPNVGGVVNNIGRTYSDMKKYDRALESYTQALAIWEETLGPKHPNVLQSYFNIGEAYGKLGEFDSATVWLQKSLHNRIETLGEKNVKVAQSFNGLGSVYVDKNNLDSALLYYQHSIISLLENFDDMNVYLNPDTMESASDLDLISSLIGKAETFRKRFKQLHHEQDIKSSLDTYEHAARLIENLRRGFSSEGAKLQLAQKAFTVYEQGIATALDLLHRTKDAQYISIAFSFAERSKAGILLDAISESKAKQFADIPDSVLEIESKLRIEITYYETQIQKEKEKRNKADKAKLAQWEHIAFDLRRRNTQLIEGFEKTYPEYHSLKYESNTVTLSDIQKRLPDNRTAVIEYFVGENTITMFAITKKQCIVKSEFISLPLSDAVKKFRNSLQNLNVPVYVDLGSKLYSTVLTPIRSELRGIRKLYIVPDGILNYLPFEPLLTKAVKNSSAVNFTTLPYLINEFEISYQVSAKFLLERNDFNLQSPTTSGDRKSARGFAGFAPVFADKPKHATPVYANVHRSDTAGGATNSSVKRSRSIDGEQFAELKESENELTGIDKLFKEHKQLSRIYLHSDANETVLKSPDIKDYRFIHIATHGVINEQKPKLSGIIFAAPESGSPEDGILYSGEIYNLRINADLVVLSACETGLGTIVKGEGILGLTRGFMYAGAKNLLVSLWQVADKSTSDLMVQFYSNILKKQSYPAALRNAKLAMIKDGKYAHPVEWSPFILTGK